MSKLIGLLKKYKWYVLVAIIVLIIGYRFTHKQVVSPFETVAATRANVVQEVSVTGRVDADSEASLSFEKSGRITAVFVDVGDKVARGDALVKLDASELTALRAQAKANVDYEEVKLDELRKGARVEDITVSQSQLDSARASLTDAERGLRDKIEIAYTESDDAIRNKVDVLLRNPRTANPEVNFSVTDAKLSARIPNDRVHLEQTLNNWALTNQSLSTSANIAEVAKSVELSIDETKAYLELLAMAINGALPTSQTSQTTIDTWKTNISVARTNVNSAITALIGADEKYRAAMHAVTIAENELSLKKAGATAESVAAQEAKIAAMRATVSNYDAQLAKNVLRASFSGVVTKQDAKLGQSVSVGQSLVSLISDGMYKITANVPEVDIAKVKIADVAEVTLDAYGSDEKFVATVSSIDPAETIIEGVPTYKVTLRFNDRDTRIKSGMTANIVMRTNEKKDVLVVPARAILLHEGDNTRYVRLLVGGVAKEIPVQIGLRGSNGMVEILSGLNQGDQVVTFEKSAQ